MQTHGRSTAALLAAAATMLSAAPAAAAGGPLDTTLPDPPSAVTSADYPADGSFHGEAGRTGTFTIQAPLTNPTNVTSYLVGLDAASVPTAATEIPAVGADHHATFLFTPRFGPHDVFVWSRNSAGISSTFTSHFLTRRGSGPAAHWSMDEGAGTTLADASGHGNTATLAGGAVRTTGPGGYGRAVTLDGRRQHAATAGPVTAPNPDTGAPEALRTDRSFAVSAWVRLTDADGARAAVSVDGSSNSGFVLGYAKKANRWAFTMFTGDRDDAAPIQALSAAAPELGAWTHLIGTFDLATGQLALYVEGRPEGAATNPRPWNATGAVEIGRAKRDGDPAQPWRGDVDDVQLWAHLLFADDAVALATTPRLAGHWPLAEGAGTSTADTAGIAPAHPGTLTGGAAWTAIRPEDARPDDGGLPDGAVAAALDGATGAVTTTGPVVLTNRSFTVAAWVRLTDAGADRAVVAQEGVHASGFVLRYSHDTGRWSIAVTSADADGATVLEAVGTSTPRVGTWTHLVGVYDATDQSLGLWVDGQPEAGLRLTVPWNAAGPLVLGRAKVAGAPAEWWAGDISDVRAYAGVLSELEIANLAGA